MRLNRSRTSDTLLEELVFFECNEGDIMTHRWLSVLYVDSSYYIEHFASVDYTNFLLVCTFD